MYPQEYWKFSRHLETNHSTIELLQCTKNNIQEDYPPVSWGSEPTSIFDGCRIRHNFLLETFFLFLGLAWDNLWFHEHDH
jgi:hypothetical protein